MPPGIPQKRTFRIKASGAETTTGSGSEFVADEAELVVHLDITAVAGSSPTLDVKVQEKDPESGAWVDTGQAFAQKTGTGTSRLAISAPVGKVLRPAWTIGGTGGPSFTFSLGGTAIRRS